MKKWQIFGIIVFTIMVASFILLVIPITKDTGDKINILLLGVDARDLEHPGNTDSISIISIDKSTKEISLLSIPRDTRVKISGRGFDKINSAYPYGGLNVTINTVEEFLGIKIDYYVLVNFQEFKGIVDTLGGIYIDIDENESAKISQLNGAKGLTKLNGDQTLAYDRFRFDSEGDVGRVKRHQKTIKAIIDEFLKPSNLAKAPSVLNQLNNNVHTNIPLLEITVLEKFFAGFNLDNSKTAIISGNWTTIDGIVYMIPNNQTKEQMVTELELRD